LLAAPRTPHDTAAQRGPAALNSSPPEGPAGSRGVDLRKVTLLRSLLHRTEEHLRLQGAADTPADPAALPPLAGAMPEHRATMSGAGAGAGVSAGNDAGSGPRWRPQLAINVPALPLWQPSGAGASQQAQYAAVRCGTPLSSDGSMGCASPSSPQSPMATSSCSGGGGGGGGGCSGGPSDALECRERCAGGSGGDADRAIAAAAAVAVGLPQHPQNLCLSGRGANGAGRGCGGPGAVGDHQGPQLASLLPFRQLAVWRPPLPPPPPQPQPQEVRHVLLVQPQQHKAKGGAAAPDIPRETLERFRAKALLVSSTHPDLEEGQCSPTAGRRASADAEGPAGGAKARTGGGAHNCGEGWSIAAWRGRGRGSGAATDAAATAAAAAAAARRRSSHI
jgi:hypothetical protein